MLPASPFSRPPVHLYPPLEAGESEAIEKMMKNVPLMLETMTAYFLGEKRESMLFIAAGAVAIAVAVGLFRSSSPYRGMMWPLALIALIQLGVGGSVYLRTDSQVAELSSLLKEDPAAFAKKEAPRMEKVLASFTLYKWIEIALMATGVALTFLYRGRDLPYSIGVGLLLQSALMLLLDLFAERRADVYIHQIKSLAGG